MKIARVVALVGALAMIVAISYGFIVGDFSQDGAIILANPWGIVSLVDLYVGFIIFSMWIVYREKNIVVSILWVVAMMVFGFLTASIYLFIALIRSKNDAVSFFMGSRAHSIKQRENT